MEKGIDYKELFANQDAREVTIVFNDKEWDFTVRELTWKQKGDCSTAGTVLDLGAKGKNKTVRMDMPAYNIAYLTKAIVKAPFPINAASFMALGDEFGDLLVAAIVDPETSDDEKNSDITSEE